MNEIAAMTNKSIDILVRRIAEEVHPLRVLLFGSAATEKMTPDSDIDLLIEMPDGTHKRKTAQHLYSVLHHIGLPFD